MHRRIRRSIPVLATAALVLAVPTAVAAPAAAATAPPAATSAANNPPPPADIKDRLAPLGSGKLTVDKKVKSLTTSVGPFEVKVRRGKPDVVITDTTTNTVVWRTIKGRAFVQGSRSEVDMTEYRGYFWPKVVRTATYNKQSLRAVEVKAGVVELRGKLSGSAGSFSWTLQLSALDRGGVPLLKAKVTTKKSAGKKLDSVQVVLRRGSEETVSGFGAQYRPYSLNGSLFPIMVREQGVGRGEEPITTTVNTGQPGAGGTLAMTYAAWPSWLTSAGRAGQVVGSARKALGTVDLRASQAVRLEMFTRKVAMELVGASTPADALQRREAGRQVPGLPDWINGGAVLGLQGGTAEVKAKLQTILDAGGKVSGLWLQDWSGRRTTSFGDRLWWTWQLDTERYPGWDTFVDELAAQGIRVLTYVNPMLVDASAKTPAPPRNLYAEAAAGNYLVKNAQGKPYLQDQGEFSAAMVDLTNPDARSWYADVIATQVLAGKVAGMMADFGEGLPYDGVLQGGSGAKWHNAYPRLWAETVRDGCTRAGKPDCVAFMRSGTSGSAGYAPLFWGGDQNVSFARQDGLPSALWGIQAAGASGWPFMHSDVGGYTSIALVNYVRPVDLNTRWAEFEAFGVFMRTHEGNQPSRNLQVYSDAQQADGFARATRIYAALADYRRSVVAESVATNLPAMRHPSLVVPGTAAAQKDDQFFLGGHLMVAPVLRQGATSVAVTFPPGQWRHVLTGEVFTGDTAVTVAAPLGQPAAFVRVDDPVGAQIRAALLAAGVAS
jgi:alpha-glucosidase (family GH31 glycosyl hydrolase)